MGGGDILPAQHGRFFVFQVFVNVEKVDDFFEDVRGQIGQMLNALKARVGGGDGQDLLIRAFLVAHHQDAQRPGGDQAAGKSRLGRNDENIQRVAVFGQRVANPAIIKRVKQRRIQRPIQLEDAQIMVIFVFVGRPLRDFDNHVDDDRSLIAQRHFEI